MYGSYSSICVFIDVYRAINYDFAAVVKTEEPISEIMKYAGTRQVPVWLAASYFLSNLTLNCLNWYWMGQMIKTIRKRFDPPFGTKVPEETKTKVENLELKKGVYEDGTKSVSLEAKEVRRRPAPQRMVTENGMMIP